MTTPLLDILNSPADLRALPPTELPRLAAQLREFLVGSVAQTGGHLASPGDKKAVQVHERGKHYHDGRGVSTGKQLWMGPHLLVLTCHGGTGTILLRGNATAWEPRVPLRGTHR